MFTCYMPQIYIDSRNKILTIIKPCLHAGRIHCLFPLYILHVYICDLFNRLFSQGDRRGRYLEHSRRRPEVWKDFTHTRLTGPTVQ